MYSWYQPQVSCLDAELHPKKTVLFANSLADMDKSDELGPLSKHRDSLTEIIAQTLPPHPTILPPGFTLQHRVRPKKIMGKSTSEAKEGQRLRAGKALAQRLERERRLARAEQNIEIGRLHSSVPSSGWTPLLFPAPPNVFEKGSDTREHANIPWCKIIETSNLLRKEKHTSTLQACLVAVRHFPLFFPQTFPVGRQDRDECHWVNLDTSFISSAQTHTHTYSTATLKRTIPLCHSHSHTTLCPLFYTMHPPPPLENTHVHVSRRPSPRTEAQ